MLEPEFEAGAVARGVAQPVLHDAGRRREIDRQCARSDPDLRPFDDGVRRRGGAHEVDIADPIVAGLLQVEAAHQRFGVQADAFQPDAAAESVVCGLVDVVLRAQRRRQHDGGSEDEDARERDARGVRSHARTARRAECVGHAVGSIGMQRMLARGEPLT